MKRFGGFLKHHKKIIILITVVILVAAGVFTFLRTRTRHTAAEREPVITTEEIKRMDLSNSVSITGTIAANDSQTVYSNNSGCEVMSMNVEIGDHVEAGDIICVLDSSDYEENIAEIQKDMSVASQKLALNVEQAQRSLAEAQADAVTDAARAQEKVDQTVEDYTAVVDSKSSAYNTYQLAISNREDKQKSLSTQQSRLKEAKKALEEAQEAQKQAESALADGTGDQVAVDAAIQAVTDAQSEVDSRNAKVTSAKAEVEAAEKEEESAKASYESFGDKLESAVRSYESALEAQQDTATQAGRTITGKEESLTSANLDAATTNDDNKKKLEEYQKLIDKCTVTAPISGIVTSINIEVGDEIAQDNNKICVIQDNSGYMVEASVDQYDISSLYEGMEAVIKTDATEDLEMQGKVTFVSPTPEESSAGNSSGSVAYAVEISIANPDERLRIGMTAETSVLTETAKNVLAVPYDCIEEDEDGNSVIHVTEKKARPEKGRSEETGDRPSTEQKEIVVETGLESDYYTEIISDEITEGMLVIVPNAVTQGSGEQNIFEGTMGGPGGEHGGGMGGPGGMGGGPGR